MSLTSARVAGRQVSELRRDSDREVGTREGEQNDSHEKDVVKNATQRTTAVKTGCRKREEHGKKKVACGCGIDDS